MSQPASSSEWFSVGETARKLNISSDLVRKMIRSGEIEARKFGRIIRVRASSLESAGKPLSIAGTR